MFHTPTQQGTVLMCSLELEIISLQIQVFCYSKFWKHLFIYSQGGPILFQYSSIQLFLETVYCPSTSANLGDEIYQLKPFHLGL